MNLETITVPQNKADLLFNLFSAEYCIYRDSITNKLIAVNSENQLIEFSKNNICKLLRGLYFNQAKQTISNEPINNAWYMIESISNLCSDYIRIVDLSYQNDNLLIYNIIGSDSYVQIKKNSYKLIKKSANKKLYIRSNTLNQFIEPELSVDKSALLEFIDNINIDDNSKLLLAVYATSLFIPNINHPILFAVGDYGASKTTTLKMIGNIYHPYHCEVVSLPKNEDEAAVLIDNSEYTIFDNVSYINRSMADLLCLSVTNGSYCKRELYTNSKVVNLNIHKPVAISSINRNIKYADLIDRSIAIDFKRIPPEKLVTEEILWKKFYSMLPKIQGSIFKILSIALAKYDSIKISKHPRLADFAKWGYAIAEAIGEGNGEVFLQQYSDNLNLTFKNSISENPLLNTVEIFMSDKEYWEGTASELLSELKKTYQIINVTNIMPLSFPSAANVLTRQINSSINELKILGISVEITRSTTRKIKLLHIGGTSDEKN